MNIKFKKLMSVLLCCVMLFGMVPANAFAIETGEQSGIVLEENIPEAPVDEVIPSSNEPVIPPVEEPLVEEPPVEEPPVVPPVEEPPVVPVEDEPVMEEEVPEEEVTSRFEEFKVQIEELQAQAKELDQNSDSFEAESEVLLEKADAFDNAVSTAYEDGILSEDEYNALSQMSADFYQIVFGEENDNHVEDAAAYAPSHGGSGGNSSTFDHFDIACDSLTAKIGVDTVTFSFTPNDVKNGNVEVYINGTKYTSANGTSTDSEGNNQVRIEGTFDVGTKTSPTEYTIQLKKKVTTEKYGDVVVTLSVSTNFWADNNVCPGGGNSKGIDVKLSSGTGEPNYTKLDISKVVEGLTFSENKTYTFDIKSGNIVVETATIEVVAGSTAGVTMVTGLAAGTYNVVERTEDAAVEGYTLNVSYSENPVVVSFEEAGAVEVKNSYTSEKTEITVTKVWDDANNQDGIRPESVTVNLLANGKDTRKTLVLSASNNWSGTFADLEQFDENGEIKYSVTDSAPGYTFSVTGNQENGFVITNKHTPEQIRVTITKEWNDADDQDGKRPASITAVLYANDVKHSDLTITAEENWTKTIGNLPKYAAGKEIVYTVKEINVPDGYTASENGLTITNSYQPAAVSVSGTKIWNDKNDQDGIRPDSITINLWADGKKIDDVEVNAKNNWQYEFVNLPKYRDGGVEIVYTVTENEVKGYTTAINGYNITNTHEVEKTSVSGSKTWLDADNQDGKRPGSITITLWADGEVVESKVVTEADKWAWNFTDLDVNKNGEKITYTITESAVDGYVSKVEGFNVTNTHEVEKTSVSGTKTWADNDNQDGIRPKSITVNLLANGVKVDSQAVNAKSEWKYTFTDLDKYEAGKEIEYTVTEEAVAGYDATITGFDITNTHTPAKTSVSGSKTWDDNNDQDGIRPDSITITLWADGEFVESKVVTEADNWAWNFTDLDVNKNGEKITYTITESAVDGYVSKVEGFNVTNTHEVEKTSVSGTKTWADNDNQDGIRPASITVNLLANGVKVDSQAVNAKSEWKYTFTDLDKYEAGKEIVYTVTEEAVEGYTTVIDGFDITNTHTPATIEISVSKIWDDNNNQDGIRPNTITVALKANRDEVATLELNEGNGWAGTFENLPKFENGKEIKYYVEESGVPEGYHSEIAETDIGFSVTNTHTPEKISVAVTKEWDDAENQDGIRPASVTINLMDGDKVVDTVILDAENEWSYVFADLDKKAAGKDIEYTVQEISVPAGYTVAVTGDIAEGYTVTNTHAPEKTSVAVSKVWDDADNQDGKRPEAVTINLLANGEKVDSLILNAANEWRSEFTELDKFAAGVEIVYTVSEDAVAEYKDPAITGTAADGYTVTNTHVPETVEVSGKKTWVDADNQDGKRPASITINLLADGTVIDTETASEANGWSWTFKDLPKYKDGTEIAYTITETKVEEYSTEINGYDVINSYTPKQTSVTVTKVWEDAGNQDGIRPNDITITLLADGVDTGKTLTLNSGNWTGSFTGLDVYKAGKEIVYTVQEQAVPGYTTQITGTAADGYVVTNSHTPAVITVEGSKIWDDADDHDGFRPDEITINLLADGEKIASKTVTEADGWKWSFDNLPKYKVGAVRQEVVYTISEDKVERYTTEIDGYDVTNSYTPQKTAVAVTKVWLDAQNQDGIRPNDITVKLLADGVATEKTLVLSVGNNWSGSFTDLDKYKDGKEIVYTIAEVEVPEGYTSEITGTATEGFTVTNAHTPAVVTVSGAKTWEDHKNQDGKRPESITIRLLADGKEIKVIEVDEAAEWKWTFENLPKFAAGKEIVYTITEDVVDGYTADIKDFDVTNTHNPEKTTVTVTKVWEDSNDQDGLRPESVTINLLANGEKVKSQKIKEDDKWTYTFEKLDKFEAGKEIVYTVTEEAVEGYNTVITGDAAKGFTVTNSHTPEVIDIAGTKTWDDGNNQDGKRPDAITVNLLANGKVIDTVKVTSAEKWTYLFTNLPKFEAGEEIIYTVTEDAVEDYTTTYDGYNIINKYTPKKTSITVTKRWVDGQNHDGIRPNSVKVVLYANGKQVDKMRLTEKGKWTGVFKDLPVYQNGEPIKYTLQEKTVSGYNATITGNARKGFIVTNTHNIIPKTGDESNLPLYTGLFGAGFSAMAVLLFLAKPRKKGKYAR